MRGFLALLVGRAEANGRAAGDEARPVAHLLRPLQRRLDRLRVLPVNEAIVRQPCASKRLTWSVEVASDVGPSMEISYRPKAR